MRLNQRNACLGVVAAGAAVAAFWLAPSGPGIAATPRVTMEAFLHASATGDARTACRLLSPHARTQVATGATCVAGIRLGVSVYGPIIKQIRVSDLAVHGSSATASSTLDGRRTASFELRKQGGAWVIVDERRVGSPTAGSADSGSSGPSEARVEAVAGCLDRSFGVVDDGGLDDTGGTAHAILSVDTAGSTAAEVNVFSSALTALSGYRPIATREAGLTTTLASASVIVYFKSLSAGERRTIEACG
jgi:limonene-1,2-epoxide hydrolase